MTCILIDDEQDCLELLALMVTKYCPNLEIIGQYDKPKAAIEAIWDKRPELVFLDVDMPETNGFGVLDTCREVPFQVVFTTAYQEYAVKAFKYSATGYLLKPIDRNDLVEAVLKAQQMHSVKHLTEQRAVLFSYLHPSQSNREKIALQTSEGIVFLPVADIEYCEADGNYTKIYLSLKEQPMLFVKMLKDIEEMLQGEDFFRPHNSYLVNLKKVAQYKRGDKVELLMNNKGTVPVVRPKKQELQKRLEKM